MDKKIVHVGHSLAYGGLERVISDLTIKDMEGFKQYIMIVWNIVTYKTTAEIIPLGGERVLGFKESKIKNKGFLQRIRTTLLPFFLNISIFLNLLQLRPSVVVVHGIIQSRYVLLSTLFLDFKLVVVNHSHHDYGKASKSPIIKFLIKRKVDKIVAVSQGVKNATKRMFNLTDSKVVTIYNGCDPDNISKLSNEKIDFSWWNNEDLKIISVGRLSNIKGQSHLVKLVKEMKDRGIKRIKLLIIGGYGPHKSDLINYIEALGLKNNVKVLDFIENPFPYLKQADIFYLSSNSEGLSIVLLEALALKTPVISTDSLVGPREIILGKSNYSEIVKDRYLIGEYGILTPVMGRSCWDNPDESLSKSQRINADALYMLINDKRLLTKYRATKYPNKFLTDTMINKYRELYLDLNS